MDKMLVMIELAVLKSYNHTLEASETYKEVMYKRKKREQK